MANPPYGVRLTDAQALAAFYPQLGDALKQRFAGWTAYFLTGDLRLARPFDRGLHLGLSVGLRSALPPCHILKEQEQRHQPTDANNPNTRFVHDASRVSAYAE